MTERVSLGVTTDFDWYELTQIKAQLDMISSRVERLVNVIHEREREQHAYIAHLIKKSDNLQAKLNALLEKQDAV